MISDILYEAVNEIDQYLENDFYKGELRERIISVRNQMDGLRNDLDNPPVHRKEAFSALTH